MKVTRKITVDRRERAILDNFLNVCNNWLEVSSSDEICDLLNAISAKDSAVDIGDDVFSIEYTDQGLYSP